MHDLIIIGGGPAALSASIYAARKKLNFIVLSQRLGGEQLLAAGEIKNWPGTISVLGPDLAKQFQEHAKDYKVDIKDGEEATKIEKKGENFLVKTKKNEYEAKSIVIASGKKPRQLGIPGEKEFETKGVSYCSTCDAPLFSGKTVVVVGGGNAGLDSAMDLTKYADKVYVLEFGPKMIGDEATQEKLKTTKKVEFILKAQTKEIKGDKFVTSIVYEDRDKKEERELEVQGVFVHIGSVTSTEFVKGFLKTTSSGEIITDHKTCQTSVEGVFAAGDVTDTLVKQVVVASSEGAKAALSAYTYLEK
ncbi:NAD(P)/FAD-dependent oxidoreductase [Patescibacteria group bacterium]